MNSDRNPSPTLSAFRSQRLLKSAHTKSVSSAIVAQSASGPLSKTQSQILQRTDSSKLNRKMLHIQKKMKSDFAIFQSLKQDISAAHNNYTGGSAQTTSRERLKTTIDKRPLTAQEHQQYEQEKSDFRNLMSHVNKTGSLGEKRPKSISAMTSFSSHPVEVPAYYQKLLKIKKEALDQDLQQIDRISVETFKSFKSRINLYNKYYTNFLIDPPDYLSLKDKNLGVKQFSLLEGLNSATQGFFRHNTVKKEFTKIRAGSFVDEEGKARQLRDSNILTELLVAEAPSKNDKDKREIDSLYQQKMETVEQEKRAFSNINNLLTDQQKFGELERNFFKAVKNGDLDTARLLLHDDANLVRARDETNSTCLHWAVRRSQLRMIEFLIEKGAELHARDLCDRTARDVAIKMGNAAINKAIYNFGGSSRISMVRKNNPTKSPGRLASPEKKVETLWKLKPQAEDYVDEIDPSSVE